MIAPADVTAAILAGGTSSRMGTNKALLKLGNTTFIQRIAGTLGSVFERVVIIANRADEYAFLHLPIFSDIYPQCGPLGGLHSALVHSSTPHVFIASCDIPFITDAMTRALLENASAETTTIASDGEQTHPLFGIYPTTLLTAVEHALHSGQRSMFAFLSTQNVNVLDFSPFRAQLRNINTIEEYQALISTLR